MQSPPPLNNATVTYHLPRNVLIQIWWRRMMFRPKMIIWTTILVAVGAAFLALRGDASVFGLFVIALALIIPFGGYRSLLKAVDSNAQLTDRKQLEFNSHRMVITGPNWKSELPWTSFQGFSEDQDYFYLHLSDNGLASVIPKLAFTHDQQLQFRECAQVNNLIRPKKR
jgi:hypothetical protein